jgi:predicted membrane channel-forming protein YqfA (hemolysin III family)
MITPSAAGEARGSDMYIFLRIIGLIAIVVGIMEMMVGGSSIAPVVAAISLLGGALLLALAQILVSLDGLVEVGQRLAGKAD